LRTISAYDPSSLKDRTSMRRTRFMAATLATLVASKLSFTLWTNEA